MTDWRPPIGSTVVLGDKHPFRGQRARVVRYTTTPRGMRSAVVRLIRDDQMDGHECSVIEPGDIARVED